MYYPYILQSCQTHYFFDSLGFSKQKIVSSVECGKFLFSSNLHAFYVFCCCIVLAKTSRMKLNRSGESVFPCLVPNLRSKMFNLSFLIMMLAVGFFVDAFYQVEKVSIFSLLRGCCFHEWMLTFVKYFFLFFSLFFYFYFFIVVQLQLSAFSPHFFYII